MEQDRLEQNKRFFSFLFFDRSFVERVRVRARRRSISRRVLVVLLKKQQQQWVTQ